MASMAAASPAIAESQQTPQTQPLDVVMSSSSLNPRLVPYINQGEDPYVHFAKIYADLRGKIIKSFGLLETQYTRGDLRSVLFGIMVSSEKMPKPLGKVEDNELYQIGDRYVIKIREGQQTTQECMDSLLAGRMDLDQDHVIQPDEARAFRDSFQKSHYFSSDYVLAKCRQYLNSKQQSAEQVQLILD